MIVDRMQIKRVDGRVIEEVYKAEDLRVIGWIKSMSLSPEETDCPTIKLIRCSDLNTEWVHVFDHISDEHRSFCDGRMPGNVYADYQEEFVPDLDPRVLRILREEDIRHE